MKRARGLSLCSGRYDSIICSCKCSCKSARTLLPLPKSVSGELVLNRNQRNWWRCLALLAPPPEHRRPGLQPGWSHWSGITRDLSGRRNRPHLGLLNHRFVITGSVFKCAGTVTSFAVWNLGISRSESGSVEHDGFARSGGSNRFSARERHQRAIRMSRRDVFGVGCEEKWGR